MLLCGLKKKKFIPEDKNKDMQTVREIWGRKSIYGKLPIAQIEFPVDDK